MATLIISREEARAQGLKRFFTGDPCRNGHVAERLVSNGFCRECRKDVWQTFKRNNPDKVSANKDRQNRRSVEVGYFRDYYARNQMSRRAGARAWYDNNKDRHAETVERWKAENRDKVRAIGRKGRRTRRARLLGAEGSHTHADLAAIFERQGGKCALCACSLAKAKVEVDHIIPLARGGHNGPANLQYLCRPCNRAKSAKDPIEFAQERGLLL